MALTSFIEWSDDITDLGINIEEEDVMVNTLDDFHELIAGRRAK